MSALLRFRPGHLQLLKLGFCGGGERGTDFGVKRGYSVLFVSNGSEAGINGPLFIVQV